MDPFTAAILAIVTALISQAPNIVTDVEKLIQAIKGGDGNAPAPNAPPQPISPEVIAAMEANLAILKASLAEQGTAAGQSAYLAAASAGPA